MLVHTNFCPESGGGPITGFDPGHGEDVGLLPGMCFLPVKYSTFIVL